MTIDVPCSGCGQKLQVGAEHAGKMARCPACGHITPVPSDNGQSVPSSAADESFPGERPANWYLRTPEGQEYGPASHGDVERWVAEGRVTADCQLKSSDTEPWQAADRHFPVLTPPPPKPAWTPPATLASPVAYQSSTAALAAAPFAGGYSAPSSAAPSPVYQMQHRGGLILLLGLLGIVLQPCPGPFFAIAAWVMGSNDLRDMESGRMDRSGTDLTRAGMIMGMIISVLWIIGLLGVGGIIFLAALAG